MSIRSSFSYIRFGFFLLLMLFLFEKRDDFFKNLNRVILFSIIILFLDSTIQYFFGANVLGYPKDSRISSFFGDEKILGSFVVRFIPIYLSLYYFNRKNNSLDYKIFLILIIGLFLILLSSERSALGLFIIYISLLSLVFIREAKKIFLFILAIIISVIITFYSSDRLYKRYVEDFINQMKAPSTILHNYNNTKFYIFTEAHDAMFRSAYKMFKYKPITGHGTKTFRIQCNKDEYSFHSKRYSCNTHPHNYYVQMLAENGLVGFVFLIFCFLYFSYLYLNNLFKRTYKIELNLIILSNIINLWPIVPHGNFFNNWISIVTFLSFSIFLCLKNKC